jgi:hypothetical protein
VIGFHESGVDNAHAFLTNAVISAAWCGWFTKARSVSDPNNFNPEYVHDNGTV